MAESEMFGDALGLYAKLKEIGPVSAEGLAEAAGCAPRYVREWLSAQTASGYVSHERSSSDKRSCGCARATPCARSPAAG